MQEPQGFCKAVMHEYERQWSRAGGHAVRHPLRLKMEQLKVWCADACSAEDFDARLAAAQSSEDIGQVLLAEELLPLWHTVCAGGALPFTGD
jgi:hypothetical protein